jgi:hypothetical protein
MTTNFPEGTEEAPEVPVSAEQPPKQVRGRPFTKENAKRMAISAAAAKKRRKDTRHRMLMALTSELDLGDELVKAFKAHDTEQIALIEKAIRMIGLHYDQSDEGKTQNLNVDSKAEVRSNVVGGIQIEFTEAVKPCDT